MLAGAALFIRVSPRPGRPESWWVSTETKALLSATLIMVLVLSGVGMIARGLIA